MNATVRVLCVVVGLLSVVRVGWCDRPMPSRAAVRQITVDGGHRPCFFPDGKRLAYLKPLDDGRQQLRVVNAATGKSRAVGKVDSADRPGVSPDASRIAFVDGPVFNRRLWTVDSVTGKATCLTKSGGFRSGPSWIDGGKGLAFAKGFGRKRKTVAIASTGAGTTAKSIPNIPPGIPTFSPRGRFVAVVAPDAKGVLQIRVVDRKGKDVVTIPPYVRRPSGTMPRGCYDPAFSPDGRYLAYVRSDIQPLSDIHLVDLKTGHQAALTSDHADNQAPAFSPDGQSMAFVAAKKGASHQVWLMTLKNAAPTTRPATKPRDKAK